MRRVDVRTIPEGAILARPLVDQRGAFVLAAGKPVSEAMRERLWDRGFRYAYIEAPGFEGLDVREPLTDQTYQLVRHTLAQVVAEVRHCKDPGEVSLPVDELHEACNVSCEDLARQQQGFLFYPPWGTLADRFVAQSINIAVVAARLGFELAGEEGARHLFLAGLLQDLGQWWDDRPSEHVAASLSLVRGLRSISAWVKHIIADHHERLDGSGYPQGKTAEQLHPLSRIMAVATAYVEMVFAPRHPTLPHEAQEHLMAEAGVLFDWDAVQALRRLVPGYPVGSVVRLSTGQWGVVVDPGPPTLNRPRVRLLAQPGRGEDDGAGAGDEASPEVAAGAGEGAVPEGSGEPASYEEIDLAAQHAVAIVRLLDR
ncbi:MAG TPA: HD domain-containing phosphohydrolase [Limnochordales bacterium]|nr:HD domain-containing phosphohydrolase [Limnochordales bacterium]